MKELALKLLALTAMSCEAFYQPFYQSTLPQVTPQTNDQLKQALCNWQNGKCNDTPLMIIINGTFNFTDSEGYSTELGCYHLSTPICKLQGQVKLNISNQCAGLEPVNVTYSVAGRQGLYVGSNKVILGLPGARLVGKGLMLQSVQNVEIRNVTVTDINPRVIWGGDAIDIQNSTNVLLDGVYIKNIGRQMIVIHYGTSTGILIRNSVFDGNTPYGPYCNNRHYWLWLFLGSNDQIALQNNVVFMTNGRGPHLTATTGSKAILHMIQNIFYDITDPGLLIEQQPDLDSSILAEGNIFSNVTHVVSTLTAHIYFPLTQQDADQCKQALGRSCLVNIVDQSGDASPTNSPIVMQDFGRIKNSVVSPIDMVKEMTDQTTIPDHVKQLIPETQATGDDSNKKPPPKPHPKCHKKHHSKCHKKCHLK